MRPVSYTHLDVYKRQGFESLAAERARMIEQLTAERDGLRVDLKAKSELESQSAKTIGELETKLENEKKNLQEKLALLEAAKQTLANQFEALAGDILEKKTKSFSEGSQKELGTLLAPLKEQINEFRKKVEEAPVSYTHLDVYKRQMLVM